MKKSVLLLSLFLSTFFVSYSQHTLESCNNSSIVCKARSLQSTTYNLLKTSHGYIQVGPANSSFAHFNTNMSRFYFNKDIYTRNGGFSSYSGRNLYLKTGGTTRVTINRYNGNMGIGVSSPQKKLDVGGDVKIKNNLYLIGKADIYGDAEIDGKALIRGNTTLAGRADINGHTKIKMSLTVEENSVLEQNLTVGNQVAIGTDILPGYSLAVCGKIRATEVKVNAASQWCDYVFEDNYDLRDLSEVDAFIKENKHLPEIPSAEVVDKEGIEVSAMMILMMKKIEELTLYTIEQEKRINQLEKNN